jgi:hypothetical protein
MTVEHKTPFAARRQRHKRQRRPRRVAEPQPANIDAFRLQHIKQIMTKRIIADLPKKRAMIA